MLDVTLVVSSGGPRTVRPLLFLSLLYLTQWDLTGRRQCSKHQLSGRQHMKEVDGIISNSLGTHEGDGCGYLQNPRKKAAVVHNTTKQQTDVPLGLALRGSAPLSL
jgi:hypothetical protein